MAYREFKNESYYEQPEIGLPRTLAMMDNVMRVRQQKQQRQADLENSWKTFQATNKLPSVNRKINEGGHEVTKSAINAFKTGFKTLPAELRMKQDQLGSFDKEAIAQEENMTRLQQQIDKKRNEDPLYKPDYDTQRLMELAQDNDLPLDQDLAERNKKLADLNKTIGKNVRHDFNREQAAADYVTKRGTSSTDDDVTDNTGVRRKVHSIAKFRDENGKPGITDKHVTEYFDKDDRLYESYYLEAADQVADDWHAFKASGKPSPPWTKGLTDQDVVATLVNEPDKLTDIGKPTATQWNRISTLAKRDLKKYEDVTTQSLHDVENYNPGSGYGLTSNKFNAPADGFNTGKYSGVARTITTKTPTQPYMTLDSRSKARLNPATGEVSYSQLPRRFTLNSYQWGPYTTDKDGNKIPFAIDAKNEDEMIKKINSMPVEAFDPKKGGIIGVAPILNGYSIDKSNIMNLAYTKQTELNDKVSSNPTDEAAKTQLNGVNQILDDIGADRDFNGQLVQKYLGVDVMNNEMFIPDERDGNVKDIESRTGMNIYSDKSLSPDMKRVKQAIEARIREAQPQAIQKRKDKEAKKAAAYEENIKKITGEIPKVGSQEEYDKVPPGSKYIDPNGEVRTKAGNEPDEEKKYTEETRNAALNSESPTWWDAEVKKVYSDFKPGSHPMEFDYISKDSGKRYSWKDLVKMNNNKSEKAFEWIKNGTVKIGQYVGG